MRPRWAGSTRNPPDRWRPIRMCSRCARGSSPVRRSAPGHRAPLRTAGCLPQAGRTCRSGNQRIRRVVGHAVRVCILPSSWTEWRSFPLPGQRFWTLQDVEVRAQSGTSVALAGDRRSFTVVRLAAGALAQLSVAQRLPRPAGRASPAAARARHTTPVVRRCSSADRPRPRAASSAR